MAAGAVIGLLALAALVVGGGGGSKKKTGDKPPPTDGVQKEAPQGGDKSIVAAPQSGPQKDPSFTDLGNKLSVTSDSIDRRIKLSPIEPAASEWPGLNTLPGAWRDGAMNLVKTLPYYMAMGNVPFSIPTSADADRLYNFAREVEDAVKSGTIAGFGVNSSLAIKELLTAARTLEKVRGYESPYRWGAAYL